jgi:hypothetical protein
MNTEHAYIHGFFKRAYAYGYSENEAKNLLLKISSKKTNDVEKEEKIKPKVSLLNKILGGYVGGGMAGNLPGALIGLSLGPMVKKLDQTAPSSLEQEIIKNLNLADKNIKINDINMDHGVANAYFDPANNRVTFQNMPRNPGMLAHEMGHANIHHSKNLSNKIQNFRLSKITPFLNMAGPIGAAIATRNEEDVGEGALKGALVGAATGAPTLINEADASIRAIRAMQKSQMSKKNVFKNSLLLAPAYLTYALQHMGVPASIGAVTSWLNKRSIQTQKEEAAKKKAKKSKKK